MRQGLLILLVSWFAGIALQAADAPATVVLGIARRDAAKYDVEYRQYSRMMPVYREAGIQASLVEAGWFERPGLTVDQLVGQLRPYQAIHLTTTNEGVHTVTPELAAHADIVGKALAQYVSEGGGLFLQVQPVRYPGDQDEQYWNRALAPLGVTILHEGCFDKSRVYVGKTISTANFWYTTSVRPHPVTDGVTCLYLPEHGFGPFPGIVALTYSPEWTAVVSGESEAMSYKSGKGAQPNSLNTDAPGTYSTAPPLVAVRTLGKGRIVSYPVSPLFTGLNHRNPLWPETVETRGDPGAGRASDSMKLQLQAYRWVAEGAAANPALGGFTPPPYKPVSFPPTVDWDEQTFAEPSATPQVRGIAGIHTSLTDGQGTVADYARAAKAAGLAFIVIADPLELLTPEKLDQLKADCLAASEEGTFYACPGIEFTDAIGIRHAFWGEKIVWPGQDFQKGQYTYHLWDGKRVVHYGQYAANCGFPGSAVLDYKQLRAVGAHPENQWWYYHYLPLVYERDKLIADNYGEFLDGLGDLRWAALASFTRIRTPNDVAIGANTCVTAFRDLESGQKALNTRCAAYWAANAAGQYVTQGPAIETWQAVNSQMENDWRYTRGAQRTRLHFDVSSPAGIREVIVHDADNAPARRYLGNGATSLSRDFELVQDRQRWLTLEVVDGAGKRAFSYVILQFCYKQGLFRCGDNLNILGPTAILWHPDRSQMLPVAKTFRNGENFTLDGWDRGGPLCPMPRAWAFNQIQIEGVGWYPHSYTLNMILNTVMDVKMSSYNLQVVSMTMDELVPRFDTAERPGPALCTMPHKLADNEYFTRVDTLYAPFDRADHFVIWNYRRRREGTRDYAGALLWHEGKITFKKPVTLAGAMPMPLTMMEVPTDLDKHWGDTLIVTEADGTTKVDMLTSPDRKVRATGRIRPGGYIAPMTTLVGYQALMTPYDQDFGYDGGLPGRINVGIGKAGQHFEAGDSISYRYAYGTFADDQAGNGLIEHTMKVLNMAGGTGGYPLTVKTGEVTDATFFLTIRADGGQAAWQMGPEELIIDLPVKVTGLQDNGCAAVFSNRRPWFRFVPVLGDTAWFQEPLERGNDLWAGNVFLADNPALRLTLVVDGQADGKPPCLEVHNPTDAAITTRLWSPPQAPVVGGTTGTVSVPAGDSVWLTIANHQLTPR